MLTFGAHWEGEDLYQAATITAELTEGSDHRVGFLLDRSGSGRFPLGVSVTKTQQILNFEHPNVGPP